MPLYLASFSTQPLTSSLLHGVTCEQGANIYVYVYTHTHTHTIAWQRLHRAEW